MCPVLSCDCCIRHLVPGTMFHKTCPRGVCTLSMQENGVCSSCLPKAVCNFNNAQKYMRRNVAWCLAHVKQCCSFTALTIREASNRPHERNSVMLMLMFMRIHCGHRNPSKIKMCKKRLFESSTQSSPSYASSLLIQAGSRTSAHQAKSCD